ILLMPVFVLAGYVSSLRVRKSMLRRAFVGCGFSNIGCRLLSFNVRRTGHRCACAPLYVLSSASKLFHMIKTGAQVHPTGRGPTGCGHCQIASPAALMIRVYSCSLVV